MMLKFELHPLVRSVGLLFAVAACATTPSPDQRPEPPMGPEAAIARARVDSLRYPYTAADIEFMQGMIHHHAQALVMSGWAPTNGASAELLRLSARIINAQNDEIVVMQMWLRDRNQPTPVVDAHGMVSMPAATNSAHGGHSDHAVAMPGMLTDAQLAELKTARGPEFDRLFLTYMIQHHRGAVAMVRTLLTSPNSGQDETIFKFAADVEVDQSTEIRRMLQMLITLDP